MLSPREALLLGRRDQPTVDQKRGVRVVTEVAADSKYGSFDSQNIALGRGVIGNNALPVNSVEIICDCISQNPGRMSFEY